MPYCLIFLREQRYRSLAFGILFIMSIVATVACYMFVLACYPSDNTQVLMVMMMMEMMMMREMVMMMEIVMMRDGDER
jgi:hypothetical protein